MSDTALTTIVERSPIDLAVSGWLDAHTKSVRTHKAYADTLKQFRAALQRMGKDLDADVQTIMLTTQAFVTFSIRAERASDSTQNTWPAILCSFYDDALERYLLMPMDHAGHVLNSIKVIDRAKVEPYHNITWLEAQEMSRRLHQMDRTTLEGKQNFFLY